MAKIKKLVIIFSLIFLIFSLIFQGFILLRNSISENYITNTLILGNDPRNTPTVSIDQLSWSQGPFTISYKDVNGIYSIQTDGTEKKLLHSGKNLEFMLLDRSRKILIANNDDGSVLLLDEYGKNEEIIYVAPNGDPVSRWSISPDEQKLAINEIVVINLNTGLSKEIVPSDYENYQFFDGAYWTADSNTIYFSMSRYDANDLNYEFYYSYTIDTDVVSKIGEDRDSTDKTWANPKSLTNYLRSKNLPQLVYTRDDGRKDYHYYSLISPDRAKTIEINPWVKVNGDTIFYWILGGTAGPENCRRAGWLADNNHFIIHCNGVRVVEVDTKKVAVLTDGDEAMWFGQVFEEYFNSK